MSSKLVQRAIRSLEKLSFDPQSEEITQKEWRQFQRLFGNLKVEGIESDSSDSSESDSSGSDSSGSDSSDSSGSDSSGSGSDSDSSESESESEVDMDSSADYNPEESDSSSSEACSYHESWKKFKKQNAKKGWDKKKLRKQFLKWYDTQVLSM
jgi:hypothetical protein